MSVQAISRAMKVSGVSSSEKLLLIVLANYCDENDRCYPSQSRLASDTSLSDRTVRDVLAGLEAKGLLARTERRRPDGSRASDIIHLRLQPEIVSGGTETVSGGVGKPLPGGTEMVSGLTTFEPSTEPSIEPSGRGRASAPRPTKRCPASWMPTEFDLKAAPSLTSGEIERELAKFRDFTFSTARSDWSATFRNWLRRQEERQTHVRPDTRQTPRDDRIQRMLAGAVAAADG